MKVVDISKVTEQAKRQILEFCEEHDDWEFKDIARALNMDEDIVRNVYLESVF